MLRMEGRAAGPWEGLNLLRVLAAGRAGAPGAARGGVGASTAPLRWDAPTNCSARVRVAHTPLLPSQPPGSPQPDPRGAGSPHLT